MIDQRFYNLKATPTVAEVASGLGVEPIGGDAAALIRGFSSVDRAEVGDLVFFQPKAGSQDLETQATACVVPPGFGGGDTPQDVALLPCVDPAGAFSRAAGLIAERRQLEGGDRNLHREADIDPSAVVEPGVVIGAGVAVGPGARLGANSVLGPGVQIGRGTRIGAGAVVSCALIGDDVDIFPGAVIGEAGFGVQADGAGLRTHFGRVIVHDRVSIGANSCVDRGMLGDTVIGADTHIDNLCHIGHNVQIGSNVLMAAYAGISGSTTIGDYALFAGRVGVSDHISIGRGARIAGGSIVLNDIPAGETWGGYPAKLTKRWMRELAWLRRAAQKRS